MDDLDADTLSRAMEQHGLGELLSFAPILRGNWRQNIAVIATSGRYVFRCRPLFEDQFQIEAQFAVAHDCEFRGVTMPRALPNPCEG